MARFRKKALLAALDASSVEPHVRSFARELIASKRRRSFPLPEHTVPTARLQTVMRIRYEISPNAPIVGWREFVDALNKATCTQLLPVHVTQNQYDAVLWLCSDTQHVVGCLLFDLTKQQPTHATPDEADTGEWLTPPE